MDSPGMYRWSPPTLDIRADTPEPDPEELARLEFARLRMAAEEEGRKAGYEAGLAAGREAGHAAGFESGQAEVRRLTAQIEGILLSFSKPLSRLDAEVADALGGLSLQIAGALVGRALDQDPTLLAELVQETMDFVEATDRNVELRLHPDDLGVLSPYMAAIAGATMVPDPQLSRGDLRLHSEHLRIDATLKSRLELALASMVQRSRDDGQ